MKNIEKGFTLVEVVITIIIVGILSMASVVAYRKHLDNAKYSEGLRLIQSIQEQMDVALSFTLDESGSTNPFQPYFTDNQSTTFEFDRSAQNLGKFYIHPQNYKYFKVFDIRAPETDEEDRYGVKGYGYIIIAYYPDKDNYQLRLRLIGSSEGPYTVVKD